MGSKQTKLYYLYAAYILATILVIFCPPLTRAVARGVMHVNLMLNHYLDVIDGATALGMRLRQITALALTPIVIVALPTLIYWLIKRKMPAYVIQAVWVLWIVAAVSRLLSQ